MSALPFLPLFSVRSSWRSVRSRFRQLASMHIYDDRPDELKSSSSKGLRDCFRQWSTGRKRARIFNLVSRWDAPDKACEIGTRCLHPEIDARAADLPALHRIEKNCCRQQVITSARLKMPSDQLAIEFTHVLPAVFTAVSTSHQNGFRSRFHSVQGLNAAAIEYPSVVQFGHDAQQCIEAADLFWEFLRSPVTHGGSRLGPSR